MILDMSCMVTVLRCNSFSSFNIILNLLGFQNHAAHFQNHSCSVSFSIQNMCQSQGYRCPTKLKFFHGSRQKMNNSDQIKRAQDGPILATQHVRCAYWTLSPVLCWQVGNYYSRIEVFYKIGQTLSYWTQSEVFCLKSGLFSPFEYFYFLIQGGSCHYDWFHCCPSTYFPWTHLAHSSHYGSNHWNLIGKWEVHILLKCRIPHWISGIYTCVYIYISKLQKNEGWGYHA